MVVGVGGLVCILIKALIITSSYSSARFKGKGRKAKARPTTDSPLIGICTSRGKRRLLTNGVLMGRKTPHAVALGIPVRARGMCVRCGAMSNTIGGATFALSPTAHDRACPANSFTCRADHVTTIGLSLPRSTIGPASRASTNCLFCRDANITVFRSN